MPVYRHRNLQVVFAVTLVAVLAVSSITPALPKIARELGVSPARIGWLIMWNARHHVHPGRPVLRPHRCVPDSCHRDLLEDDRKPDSAARIRFKNHRGTERWPLPARDHRCPTSRFRHAGIHRSVRCRQETHGRRVRNHPGVDGRYRWPAACLDPVLHRAQRSRCALERVLGPGLHRHSLHDGTGRRYLRTGQHDRDPAWGSLRPGDTSRPT